MKWIAVLLLPAYLCGCSSGGIGEPPPEELVDEASCLGLGIESTAGVVEAVFAVLAKIDGGNELEHPEYVQNDCDIRTFATGLDLDEFPDDILDIVVTGHYVDVDLPTATDLCDGFGVGEHITATWDAEFGPPGTLEASGHGIFGIRRSAADRVVIAPGEGEILTIDGGCEFTVTDMNLTVDLNAVDDGPPDGWVDFSTNQGAMTGTITFDPADPDYARVSVTFDGRAWNFKLDLDTFRPEFE